MHAAPAQRVSPQGAALSTAPPTQAQVQCPSSGWCCLSACFISAVWLQVWQSHRLLNDGIASGEVQPLPWTVYSRDKAQDAFRFLAGGLALLSSLFLMLQHVR